MKVLFKLAALLTAVFSLFASAANAQPIPLHGNAGFGSWQPGMDIFDGGDYRSFPALNSDPQACLAECARDGRCRSVTYTMPGTYGLAYGKCWLKERVGRFGPHPSAMSAVKTASTLTPPPHAQVTGEWLFRGIPGQRATIRQTPDGRLHLVTEKNVGGVGYVESATTIIVDFPFARGLRATLSPDGRRLNWANGEFWSRDATVVVTPPPLPPTPPTPPRPPTPVTPPTASTPTPGCTANIQYRWYATTGDWMRSGYLFDILPNNTWASKEVGYGDQGKRDFWGSLQCIGNNTWQFQTANGAPFQVFPTLQLRADGNLHNDQKQLIFRH
jgi:hypothetical protein